jgi:hypothetical protein
MNVSKTIKQHIQKLILPILLLGFAGAANTTPSLSVSPAYTPNTLAQTIPSSGTFYNLSVLPKNLTHSSQNSHPTLERLTTRTLEQAVEANLEGGKVTLISQNNSSYALPNQMGNQMGNQMIGIRGLAQLEQGGQIRQVAFEMIVDSFYNTVVDFDARIDGKPLE